VYARRKWKWEEDGRAACKGRRVNETEGQGSEMMGFIGSSEKGFNHYCFTIMASKSIRWMERTLIIIRLNELTSKLRKEL
jgi:hypothetical protein